MMTTAANDLQDLEQKAAAGERFTREHVDRVLACPDLVAVGMVGEAARRRSFGDRVTFGRVALFDPAKMPASRGEAGEVRIVSACSSIDEARAQVRAAARLADGTPLTGYSLASLMDLCSGSCDALAELARTLKAEGLGAIAEVPLDAFTTVEQTVNAMLAVTRGGLRALRVTVDQAPPERRLELVERAAAIQARLGSIRALAPLPRQDSATAPSTGYDDVRTIAAARLLALDIPCIQVDWPLYGPKLAQVALMYGANDIDGVAALDTLDLGARRSPRADVVRQIESAASSAVERDGFYETIA